MSAFRASRRRSLALSPHRTSSPAARGAGGRAVTGRPSSLVEEGRLLEGAVDDRCWVQLQPLVEDRRVDAAEVHIRVEVALNQVFRLQGRHLAVMAALDLLAEHESDATGAVIGYAAVVADAAPELR